MSSDEDFDDESEFSNFSSEGDEEENEFEDKYYDIKDMSNNNEKKEALIKFKEVLGEMEGRQQEEEVGSFYFKSLKQVVKILFALNNSTEALVWYRKLMECVNKPPKGVSSNDVDSMLTKMDEKAKLISNYSDFVDLTFELIDPKQNQNMWTKLSLTAADNYLAAGQYDKLDNVLNAIYQQCLKPDGTEDVSRKGTRLKQVFALRIQMYFQQDNHKPLKGLFQKCESIEAAIPPASVAGVIQECGGRLSMKDGRYEDAKAYFFKAFQSFDHAADSRRKSNLKYHVLAVMLQQKDVSEAHVNPFDADEAQTYRNDPEIKPMADLFEAHSKQDSERFTKVLKTEKTHILDDPFIALYLSEMIEVFQSQVISRMILPYKHVSLELIANKLGINIELCSRLVAIMILNGEIKASVNEVTGILSKNEAAPIQLEPLREWTKSIAACHQKLVL